MIGTSVIPGDGFARMAFELRRSILQRAFTPERRSAIGGTFPATTGKTSFRRPGRGPRWLVAPADGTPSNGGADLSPVMADTHRASR